MRPKLSIIIPVHNVAQYLSQCLESVTAQSLKEIEILCINDASADESLEILKRFEQEDKRIKIVSIAHSGQGNARNTGIRMAQGEYTGFVDGDDWVEHGMFEALYHYASREDCDIAGCFTDCCDAFTGKKKRIPYFETEKKIGGEAQEIYYDAESIPDILPQLTVVAWNKIYRTSFLSEKKIVFYPQPPHEDIYFSFRALLAATRIGIVRKSFYHYRINRQASTMNSFHTGNHNHIIAVLNATENAIAPALRSQTVRQAFLLFRTRQLLQSLNAVLLRRHIDAQTKSAFFHTVRQLLLVPDPSLTMMLNSSEKRQLYCLRKNWQKLYQTRLTLYRLKSGVF